MGLVQQFFARLQQLPGGAPAPTVAHSLAALTILCVRAPHFAERRDFLKI